jgi:predicted nucleic acid-binding protein
VMETAHQFRQRLKGFGFTDPAIDAAWPNWWSDEADTSVSAQAELRFSVARKLGLEPQSLLEDRDQPKFIWRDEARFKRIAGETELERAGITSFGVTIANFLIAATASLAQPPIMTASGLRELILQRQDFVRLADILSLSWSIGIPVIHLRVFPWLRKRMSAMTLRRGDRHAILVAKESMYPAPIAFYIAHELGHAFLGHLQPGNVVVDLEDERLTPPAEDPEEAAADRFALELLTGAASPTVLASTDSHISAAGLADAVLDSSQALQIEPGTLALCFGYSTGNWQVANAALSRIYTTQKPVWREINQVAVQQLVAERMPDDAVSFLTAVMGGIGPT